MKLFKAHIDETISVGLLLAFQKASKAWHAGLSLRRLSTKLTMDNYEMGHIVSKALGGDNKLDNLCLLCVACNRSMFHATTSPWIEPREVH